MKTLVIGVGNLLRCDDGVGIHVVNRLEEAAPNIDTLDVALGSIEILEAMMGRDRVFIIDAIQAGGEPGMIYSVNLSGGEEPPRITHSHGVDLLTTLKLGDSLFPGQMPKEIILLAVEAEDVTTLGESCTSKVQAAIEKVVEIILGFEKNE
ncbi:hydrogenase maturation protease [Candidatus Bathyarchaeota archaeon]|nr:hydrogenase maturation protease [Candidatus Bathyarchaeota archaeon]